VATARPATATPAECKSRRVWPYRQQAGGPGWQRAGITNNIALFSRRADNVVAYLEPQCVNPNIISAKGFGNTHPVASNDGSDGVQRNRRIEIVLESRDA
jgi:hypothetical protein